MKTESLPALSFQWQPSTASASTPIPILVPPSQPNDPTQRCTICNEILGLPSLDGRIEIASILPCSHIFGSVCITRWLAEGTNNDCPNCRRKMVYRSCGHLIKPCNVSRAPRCVREKDMPKKCIVCRGNVKLEGELRAMNQRRLLEESVLEGMRLYLPTVFGDMGRNTVEGLDERIEEVRKAWSDDVEALCSAFEEKDGRDQW